MGTIRSQLGRNVPRFLWVPGSIEYSSYVYKHRACHLDLQRWHFSCTVFIVTGTIPVNPVRKADRSKRRPENAPGCFFIDDECISCGACWRLAPTFIFSHSVHTFAFFSRQPVTDRETRVAEEALLICPVGAIGAEDSA